MLKKSIQHFLHSSGNRLYPQNIKKEHPINYKKEWFFYISKDAVNQQALNISFSIITPYSKIFFIGMYIIKIIFVIKNMYSFKNFL